MVGFFLLGPVGAPHVSLAQMEVPMIPLLGQQGVPSAVAGALSIAVTGVHAPVAEVPAATIAHAIALFADVTAQCSQGEDLSGLPSGKGHEALLAIGRAHV